MPIYEYECTKCGHQTEVWQKFSDKALTKCDRCKGRMKKLVSQSTFHLKGSGWYVTDYASNRHGNGEKRAKTDKDTTKKESKGASEKSKKETGSSKPKGKKD